MSDNIFNKLYSKIENIYIPLPNFEFFHQASDLGGVDKKFVGRTRISKTLKNYLSCQNQNNFSGSYLITGYRGMGKSSFVGKVIKEMIDDEEESQTPTIKPFFNRNQTKQIISCLFISFPLIITCILIILSYLHISTWLFWLIITSIIIIFLLIPGFYIYKGLSTSAKHRHIHYIHLNLGSEIKNERDVLALIAASIKEEFTSFLLTNYPTSYRYACYRFIASSVISLIAYYIFTYGMCIIGEPGYKFLYSDINPGSVKSILILLNDILVNIRNIHPLGITTGLLISMGLGAIIYRYIIRNGLVAIFKKFGKPIRTGQQIYQKLKELCERIDASIDEDNNPYGTVNTSILGFTFNQKKIRRYSKASTPEIEQQLIQIIQQVNNAKLLHSRFIIVLDELDKISLENNNVKTEKHKYEIPEFSYDTNGFPGSGSARNKKECILSLLGRLKFFVTTAQAKFVFLSGHELFDAHLADVSDREFSISSTFSGVINVNSFFSSDSQVKDVTRMTEIYLMKMLMKEEEENNKGVKREEEKYRLSNYHNIIKNILEKNAVSDYEQLQKTIIFLRQFITYLTFVSNGAPKKLNTFFEKYVISKEEYKDRIKRKKEFNTINIIEKSGYLKENEAQYYLAFGYYDQQKIGFIHYIAYPIFYTIISPSSEYGDKLLVASSFLIAHIYKHHSSGFSWRNLEYLPELLDSNRTPELRDFINSMFGYLGQMHITRITSGLYHYKFPLRLAEEISVFTKKSEEISAIFNFSLDDSRAVKQYYADLLAFHEKASNSSPINMANIHHYLGDLHLANEEYTEAIAQFRIASDLLLKEIKRNDVINTPQITSYVVRYMRAMLKLGLTYEKRNTLDSAYLVYNNLIIILIGHRYVNDDEIPMLFKHEKIDNDSIDGWREKRLIFYLSDKETKSSNDSPQNKQFIKQIRPELLEKEEEKDIYYWTYGHEVFPNFSEYLAPENLSIIAKLSTYEELRLTYLPILTKLFAVEKQHTGGITKNNIKIAEAEFKNLFLFSNYEDKFMLEVDFFRKLGDILYYKNGNYDFYRNTLDNLFNIWGYNIKSDVFDCCYKEKLNKNIIKNIINLVDNVNIKKNLMKGKYNKDKFIKSITPDIIEQSIFTKLDIPQYIINHWDSLNFCYERREEKSTLIKPCFACKYYNRSLIILGKKIIPDFINSKGTKALAFLNIIKTKDFRSQRQNEINQAALTLEAMGNVIFSCSNKNDIISDTFILSFCQYETSNKNSSSFTNLSQLEKAFLYYWAASEYHYKALNTKEGVQCVIKIMNLLATYYEGLTSRVNSVKKKSSNPDLIKKLIHTIEFVFVRKAIQGIYSNKDFYNLQEIRKVKEALGIADLHKSIPLGFLSCLPDIEELILAFYEIQISLSRLPSDLKYGNHYQIEDSIITTLYHSISLTYLRCDSLIYNRIISLLFKANLNTYMLERLFDKSINEIVGISKKVKINCLKYLLEKIDEEIVKNIINTISAKQDNIKRENIFDLLEFLITDSVFCLLQISELISPAFRTTLFTNNFCASVYNCMYNWNELKYKLEEFYKENNSDRIQSFKAINNALIDDHLIYMQTQTYIREMASKFERKALEMHTEGRSYQDFIDSFYILDDDLQNNTCQFYLALERYKINIGMISSDQDSESGKNSRSYDPLKYFDLNPDATLNDKS